MSCENVLKEINVRRQKVGSEQISVNLSAVNMEALSEALSKPWTLSPKMAECKA
jgi:hypothetical protein